MMWQNSPKETLPKETLKFFVYKEELGDLELIW